MPYNLIINQGGSGIGIYVTEPGSEVLIPLDIPAGVGSFSRYPDHVEYSRKHYIVGQPTKNLTFYEDYVRIFISGIEAPSAAPTLTPSGGGTLDGEHIGYYTFVHKIGDTVLCESNPSPPSGTATLNGTQQRAWTNIAATSLDARVTHVALYVSVDGAEPRFVKYLDIGTTSDTEDTATLALGDVAPTNNGVPPYARYEEIYHDRLWLSSGDDKVWFSEIGNFEAFGENSYIQTRDGEYVRGIRRIRDQLVVQCRRCSYDVQGYDEADFNMRKISPSIGLLSHFGSKNIDEIMWFPSEEGIYTYDGAQFKNQMDGNNRPMWRSEFDDNLEAYHNSYAGIDRLWNVYRLLIKKAPPLRSWQWIGSYRDLQNGQPIRWETDIRAREDNVLGEMDTGDGRYKTVTASCDGTIREENVDSDGTDDNDTYNKAMWIEHGADYLEDVGGGMDHAKTFCDLYTYVENPTTSVTIEFYTGNPNCGDGTRPETKTHPGDQLTGSLEEYEKHDRLTRSSGDTYVLKVKATAPVEVVYRGHSGTWKEGPRRRGIG